MATNPSAQSDAFDPMMGQLEVIEPGLAMFHGFANVAFAYGRGDMIAVDTSSRQMGEMAVAAIRKVTDEPVTLIVLHAWPRRPRIRHRRLHQGCGPSRLSSTPNLGARGRRPPVSALCTHRRMASAYQSVAIRDRDSTGTVLSSGPHRAGPYLSRHAGAGTYG